MTYIHTIVCGYIFITTLVLYTERIQVKGHIELKKLELFMDYGSVDEVFFPQFQMFIHCACIRLCQNSYLNAFVFIVAMDMYVTVIVDTLPCLTIALVPAPLWKIPRALGILQMCWVILSHWPQTQLIAPMPVHSMYMYLCLFV